jgi:DNA-binding transcriptional MerR regulator
MRVMPARRAVVTEPSYRIAEVARLVELTPRAIRHYEGMGLLRPARSKGAYRLYQADDVERLRTIRALRDDAGLSIADIQELLEDDEHREQAIADWHSAEAAHDPDTQRRIAAERLGRLDRRIALLDDKAARLGRMADDARARRARLQAALTELEDAR